MSASNASAPPLGTAVVRTAASQSERVVLFDGAGLNIDYPAYMAQQDVVYRAPALEPGDGVPLGDGDTGALLWCSDGLHIQMRKSDLWLDGPAGADGASASELVAAGSITIRTDPPFLRETNRFKQRLSLHGGVTTIEADGPHGSCQITAFVCAETGVLAVRYRDQSVRGARRSIEVSLNREGHLFALGSTLGILSGLTDARYALLARVSGSSITERRQSPGSCRLVLEPARSADITLYIAITTSARDGDPVALTRERLDEAERVGFERLLTSHKQRWSRFWQRSFLRVTGAGGDSLPDFIENLWYLSLYQLASCSRGPDSPISAGGLWRPADQGPAGAHYDARDMRAVISALLAANHLDLSVPVVEACYRLLPELAARTGSAFGLGGARLPARFTRRGEEAAGAGQLDGSVEHTLGEGHRMALAIWEIWRYAPDPIFLKERAFPMMRAFVEYALDRSEANPTLLQNNGVSAQLALALDALIRAARSAGITDEMLPRWTSVLKSITSSPVAVRDEEFDWLLGLGANEAPAVLRALLASGRPRPCGLFDTGSGLPDIGFAARFCSMLSGQMLRERPFPNRPSAGVAGDSKGSAEPVLLSALEVFGVLPAGWSAAFSLAAPGGFRVSAEAVEGRVRYVAIKSLLGERCRIVNPWGAGAEVRIVCGRKSLFDSSDPVLEFATEPNATYLVERHGQSLARSVCIRLTGRPNQEPRECAGWQLGIPKGPDSALPPEPGTRLPAGVESGVAVVSGPSRLDRARALWR